MIGPVIAQDRTTSHLVEFFLEHMKVYEGIMTDYEGNCFSVCINTLRVESFYILTVIFTYFPLLCFQHPLACRLMNKPNTGYISMCLSIAQCQSDPVCQGQLQRAGYVQGWVDERGVFHPPDTQNISEFI
jgi:hypothetical protein